MANLFPEHLREHLKASQSMAEIMRSCIDLTFRAAKNERKITREAKKSCRKNIDK